MNNLKGIINLINDYNINYVIRHTDNEIEIWFAIKGFTHMVYASNTKTISILDRPLKNMIINLPSEDQDDILKLIEEKINLKVKRFV